MYPASMKLIGGNSRVLILCIKWLFIVKKRRVVTHVKLQQQTKDRYNTLLDKMNSVVCKILLKFLPVVDKEFPRWGSRHQPSSWGHISIIWPKFSEKLHGNGKIWARGQASLAPSLDPPLLTDVLFNLEPFCDESQTGFKSKYRQSVILFFFVCKFPVT